MFRGYRSLGYYASELPLSIVRSDEDTLIASAIGEHAFFVYDSAHLQLVYMSRHIPESIQWLQATNDGFVFTLLKYGEQQEIVQFKKMHRVHSFNVPSELTAIKFLVSGDLIFVLCQEGTVLTFDRKLQSLKQRVAFKDEGSDSVTEFTDMMHPNTYVNKMLFCGHQGD